MTQIFPTITLSQEAALRAFVHETEGLVSALHSGLSEDLLGYFANYEPFLSRRRKENLGNRSWRRVFGEQRDVYFILKGADALELLYASHIAACCELFDRQQIPLTDLKIESFLKLLSIGPGGALAENVIEELRARFNSMDSVRVAQILRLLGLISRKTTKIRQLSFGSGNAIKDIRAMHLLPSIRRVNINRSSVVKALMFGVEEVCVENIVVSDWDPQHKELYKKLNLLEQPPTLAIHEDIETVLNMLPSELVNRKWPLRNLIIIQRIDHTMIPSAVEFLRKLRGVVADGADFVLTMGSGHNEKEFLGRSSLLDEFYGLLEGVGMYPVRIRLHKEGSIERQMNGNLYGVGGLVTYQILHCKIITKMLARL